MQGASAVTRGAIENIFKTGSAATQPVVQVTDLKRISSGSQGANATPRFRLAISDGTHVQQAMIATQLNPLILGGTVQINALIKLIEIICNTVQDKRIVIILNLQFVQQLPMKLGNPVSIDAVMAANSNPNNQTPAASMPVPPSNPTNSFGNPPQQQQQQQQQQIPNNRPTTFNSTAGFGGQDSKPWGAPPASTAKPNPFSSNASSGSGAFAKVGATPTNSNSLFRPINSINPYQNGWTIRGRCTFKSDVRKFQNARGEGQVVSFEVTDESGSIRITGFTQVADMIENTVHMNRIYKISKGFLKQANERFNRSTSSFEMTIDTNSVLEEVDDDGSFMQVKYNFVKIANLESVNVKATCDVVGIVTGIGPVSEIVIRSTGDPCARRSITVTDDSNSSVELTLWRKQAETFLTEEALERHPVLLLRNAVRGDFGGVSLNVSRMTTLELDPVNVAEANKLRAWYDSEGRNNAGNVQSVTAGIGGGGGKISGARKSLMEARQQDVDPVFGGGNANGSVTFVTRGVVSFVNTKNDLYYPGDPETKKKVVDQGGGVWMSESTGRQLRDEEVVWRYIVSMRIADHSGSNWVSGFDEVGSALFGRTANELRSLKEQDEKMFDHVVEDALCKPMLFKIQVKERMWREESQIRYTLMRAEPIDFASEGQLLLDEIASYGVA